MPLYLILLFITILTPITLSFDKKLKFYKSWKYLFPSIFITATFYILIDIFLTQSGVWGFNPRYLIGIKILNLPVEEWLFFIFIPYASIFLHKTVVIYFPKLRLSGKLANILSTIFIIIAIAVLLFNYDKVYTTYIFITFLLALIISFFDKSNTISTFYISYLLIFIPFFIVNGILTGSWINEEVVWYNNNENLNIRIGTIPVEDVLYSFTLIYFSLVMMKQLGSHKKTFNQ